MELKNHQKSITDTRGNARNQIDVRIQKSKAAEKQNIKYYQQ